MNQTSCFVFKLRLGSVVFGAISLGFLDITTSRTYALDEYVFYVSFPVTLFSIIQVVATCTKLVPQTLKWRQIDSGIQLAMAAMLTLGSMTFLRNTVLWASESPEEYVLLRAVTLVFIGITIILHGAVAFLLHTRHDTEPNKPEQK